MKLQSAGKSHSFSTSESSVQLLLQITPKWVLDRALTVLQGCLKVLTLKDGDVPVFI